MAGRRLPLQRAFHIGSYLSDCNAVIRPYARRTSRCFVFQTHQPLYKRALKQLCSPNMAPLPIFIPDFANLQIAQGVNMTERLTPPYSIRTSPTFGIALGNAFKHETPSFSSELESFSCAAAGAVEAFNFQYTDGTYIEANAGGAPASSVVTLLPEEHVTGVSGYVTSNQITSLQFSTSRRNITCGTGTEGSKFETEIPDGSRAVGFFGTADGGTVTSFGVQFAKLPAVRTLDKRTLANDTSNVTVTVFEPQLLITPSATNMWATNNQTALNAAKALASKELSPIYDNIIANGNEAWVESVPDPIGTFSPAGGFGAAHPHIMEGLDVGGEAAAILAGIRGVVTWYNACTKSLSTAESILDGSLDTDVQAPIYTSALADFLGVDSVSLNLIPSASAFPVYILGFLPLRADFWEQVGAIAIAIVASIAFIIEQLDRDYSLSVNVYNFDPKNHWVVDDWASNNGAISGGPFTNAALVPLNNTVSGPSGPIETLQWVASWATYVFGNKDTIGDGMFIAVQAELGTAGSGSGFTFGYRVHATSEDNQMALMDGLTDLETFVNTANGSWHQTKALTITEQVSGQTIYANSPSLSGVKSSTYTLDIAIGLPLPAVGAPLPSTTSLAPTSTHPSTTVSSSAKSTQTGSPAQGFAQCGGTGWTGATFCIAGYTCTSENAFFSQCLPQ
ncbi:Threonine--tRNA ligase [Mycena venus]|uniref:Threonine--tRNA ligase n=1 Tax=Mycena venus TaxID=2733690 RepID=A0A8H6X3J3_9AGAR|nr:Threonine--tRNA ligase [Mycena venus]